MVDEGIDPLGAGDNPVGEVSWSRMAKDSGHQSGAQREGPPRPTRSRARHASINPAFCPGVLP